MHKETLTAMKNIENTIDSRINNFEISVCDKLDNLNTTIDRQLGKLNENLKVISDILEM